MHVEFLRPMMIESVVPICERSEWLRVKSANYLVAFPSQHAIGGQVSECPRICDIARNVYAHQEGVAWCLFNSDFACRLKGADILL